MSWNKCVEMWMLLATVFLLVISIPYRIRGFNFSAEISFQSILRNECRKESLSQVVHIVLNFMRFIQFRFADLWKRTRTNDLKWFRLKFFRKTNIVATNFKRSNKSISSRLISVRCFDYLHIKQLKALKFRHAVRGCLNFVSITHLNKTFSCVGRYF